MNNIIIELGNKYFKIETKYEELAAELKKLSEEFDAAEKELIDAMIAASVKSINIEGAGKFTLSNTTYPSVTAANKPTFFEYMKAFGHGGLIKEDVNTQTLNSFLKRHRDELTAQFMMHGLEESQASFLKEHPSEVIADSVDSFVGTPMDEMDANELADKVLQSQGAAMFKKQKILRR
jgi:hypothetical protein